MNTNLPIGIPVHNGMPYLAETLQSVQWQTYGDFEILVIDDGSKDDTGEYLQSLRDPRLRVISQSNQGLTATLNRMLRECHTPWLVRRDGGGLAFPHLDAVRGSPIKRPPRAGIVTC